jgi:hypothetical protein
MNTISEDEVLLRLIKDGTFKSELSDDKAVQVWMKNLGQLAKLDVSVLEMAIENEPAMREKVDAFLESVIDNGDRGDEYLPEGWIYSVDFVMSYGPVHWIICGEEWTGDWYGSEDEACHDFWKYIKEAYPEEEEEEEEEEEAAEEEEED